MSDKLNKLMDAVVDVLLDQVENGSNEVTKDGEVIKVPASAAILNVARQFLKDHNIQPSKNNEKVKGLIASLPFDDSVPSRPN
jgi:hypothetical protein